MRKFGSKALSFAWKSLMLYRYPTQFIAAEDCLVPTSREVPKKLEHTISSTCMPSVTPNTDEQPGFEVESLLNH